MKDRERLKDVKRVVIKIGTTSLTHENGKMNLENIEKLTWVLTDLSNQGKEVILVTSGAIAVGTQRLELKTRPRDMQGKQATSAVGQASLMHIYERFFMQYGQKVAQILLTRDCIEGGKRRENARNTFERLLEWNVIPIVNENDTISIEELGFSDNDTLSSYVACLIEADALIILSDIEGLYSDDPFVNPEAKLIEKVEKIDDYIRSIAGDTSGELGTGGMATKISAATRACEDGIDTIIAKGDNPSVLFDIINGENIGTMFVCNKGGK